ncbi:DNA internalization-related competence protein ComEC/Rec2 [Corallincola platygyrae]|uniref:DNA internalization-related competence protein ComEC/Rec2 n=1 Tax=Corallincola platygyrae TaxID=1193278 RepID=A0ABW4XLR4_9GAMM
MQTALFGFIAGAIIAANLPIVPSPWIAIATSAIALCLPKRLAPFVLGVLLGLGWISFHNQQYEAQLVPDAFAGRDITTTNKIISLPQRIDDGWRFVAETKQEGEEAWHGTLRLSWYRTDEIPKMGEIWRFDVRLKPPVGFANQSGRDYERFLLSQGLHGTGYVRSKAPELLNQKQTARALLRQKLLVVTEDSNHQDLILALAMGDRSLLNSDRWELLRETGTAHLIAISGLHIGFVYWLVNGLCRVFNTRLNVTSQYPRARMIICSLFALGCCAVYAQISGMALPAQRALLAITVWCALQALQIRLSRTELLLALLAGVIIVSPYALYGISLWLSFGAVANIALLNWLWRKRSRTNFVGRLIYVLTFQLVLSVLLVPVSSLLLGFFAPLSPLANMVVVPLITLLTLPLMMLLLVILPISPTFASWLAIPIDELFSLFVYWLTLITQLDLGVIEWPSTLLVCLFAALLITLSNRRLWPMAVCIASIPLVMAFRQIDDQSWQVDVIDVGQGLSVVVQSENDVLVYDVGNRFRSGFVVAEHSLHQVLKAKGIRKIDWLVLSHNDIDHVGGAQSTLSKFDVENIMQPKPDRQSARLGNYHYCRRGQSFRLGDLEVKVLHPANPLTRNKNNHSCVLHISDGHRSILLTGDIEASIEKALVEKRLQLKADLVVAPHHGSKSSSSAAFIEAVEPDYVVFSRGAYNRYGMPHSGVVNRYRNSGSRLLDTACLGQITLKMAKTEIEVTSTRVDGASLFWPFWYQSLSGCRRAM